MNGSWKTVVKHLSNKKFNTIITNKYNYVFPYSYEGFRKGAEKRSKGGGLRAARQGRKKKDR